MRRFGLIGFGLLIGFATASPALAQDVTEDWDLAVDPAQQLTMASLDFGDNALALRCKAGRLDFLLTGVPASSDSGTIVRVTAGGIADERQHWEVLPGAPVLSASNPARLARQLRAGGDLDLRIEPAATGERPIRFRLPTPPSVAAVDQVLSACGAALTDDWDLRPRASTGVLWERIVAPEYPPVALGRGVSRGSVRLACIVPASGRFSECRVLSESTPGLNFGQNALAAARRSRVRVPENDTDSVGKVVEYTVRFRAPE